MQTSKFAVFRTVCEIYLTNSSEPYIKLKPKKVYMKVRKIDLFSVALSLSMLIICVTVDDSTVLLVTSQLTSTQGLKARS